MLPDPRGSRDALQIGDVILIRDYESRGQIKDRTRLIPQGSTCLPKACIVDCSEVHKLDYIRRTNWWHAGRVRHIGQLPPSLFFEIRCIVASAMLLSANHQALILECLPAAPGPALPNYPEFPDSSTVKTGASHLIPRFSPVIHLPWRPAPDHRALIPTTRTSALQRNTGAPAIPLYAALRFPFTWPAATNRTSTRFPTAAAIRRNIARECPA